MHTRILPILALAALTFASAPAAITMDTVYVGNLRNPADYRTGLGTVNYGYNIGKYEVTVNQYCTFLNAVGATDPYGLYNSFMGYTTLTGGGIARNGASGSYSYSVTGSGLRPISFVNWFDAARFANWMANGQPTGAPAAGSTETGSYTLNGATTGATFTRNANASWVLPSDNEWYKAAYYTPTPKLGPGVYSLYPTFSNTQPNSRYGSTTDPNAANYFYNDGLDNGYNGGYAVNNSTGIPNEYLLTDIGAFTLAKSFYGTFDQAGNVSEWSDSFQMAGYRLLLGGNWYWPELSNRSEGFRCNSEGGTSEVTQYGFRLAYIPEPSALALLALGGAVMLRRRAR